LLPRQGSLKSEDAIEICSPLAIFDQGHIDGIPGRFNTGGQDGHSLMGFQEGSQCVFRLLVCP